MPQVYDVVDYVLEPHSSLHFLIQNLLLWKGSLMVSGDPGVRKTWLLMHMAFCLSTGTDWFGFHTRQARVLFANFDAPRESMQDRLMNMYPNFNTSQQMFFVVTMRKTRLETRPSFDSFMSTIRDYQPQVVFLDCLRACFGGNENEPQQLNPFLANMEEMQAELGTSFVISHHNNKNPLYSSALSKVSGTTWLTGSIDTVIHLVRQPVGYQMQFAKHRHSRIDQIGNVNLLFTQDCNWVVRGRQQQGEVG